VPAPADLLDLVPVGTGVNDVRNDGPELIEPIEPEATLL
jgi:putative SOS response-associated peptidase YedK